MNKIIIYVGYIYYARFELQPMNFTRKAGDHNVFVPCPYGGPAVPSWKIGSSYHSSTTLPNHFKIVPSGLLITTILYIMSGLSFQCFTPTGKAVSVYKSSVGTLMVDDNLSDGKLTITVCDNDNVISSTLLIV